MSRSSRPTTLFIPIVPPERLHDSFAKLSTYAQSAPSRGMMDEVFAEFDDVDGNFLEQFQTTGFDARVWELYLFALFSRTGFKVDRRTGGADFHLTKGGTSVVAEAVTANPSPVTATMGRAIDEPNALDIFAIKLGSPLTSKLAKRYWEAPTAKDKPLLFCVEAFFDAEALSFSSSGLQIYLYGSSPLPGALTDIGYKSIEVPVHSHEHGAKAIPSGFFHLPDAQHVSAVLFSNAGTTAKFNRMGHQGKYRASNLRMFRLGDCFDADPRALEPLPFRYEVGSGEYEEPWSDGVTVFHNPNASCPLTPDVFDDGVCQYWMNAGAMICKMPSFHAYSSKTALMLLPDEGKHAPARS
jgi:hypothetical protein